MATKKELEKAKKGKLKVAVGGEALKQALLKDDTFKRYRQIVKRLAESLDLEEIDTEIDMLHAGRKSRNLKGTGPSSKTLIDAALQDTSNRSRLAEIRRKLTKQGENLDIAIQAAKMHIASEYADKMASFSTKAERSQYLDAYVSKGVNLHRKIKLLVDDIDFYIKDIDATHFQLKLTWQCLEIVHGKGREL